MQQSLRLLCNFREALGRTSVGVVEAGSNIGGESIASRRYQLGRGGARGKCCVHFDAVGGRFSCVS